MNTMNIDTNDFFSIGVGDFQLFTVLCTVHKCSWPGMEDKRFSLVSVSEISNCYGN